MTSDQSSRTACTSLSAASCLPLLQGQHNRHICKCPDLRCGVGAQSNLDLQERQRPNLQDICCRYTNPVRFIAHHCNALPAACTTAMWLLPRAVGDCLCAYLIPRQDDHPEQQVGYLCAQRSKEIQFLTDSCPLCHLHVHATNSLQCVHGQQLLNFRSWQHITHTANSMLAAQCLVPQHGTVSAPAQTSTKRHVQSIITAGHSLSHLIELSAQAMQRVEQGQERGEEVQPRESLPCPCPGSIAWW